MTPPIRTDLVSPSPPWLNYHDHTERMRGTTLTDFSIDDQGRLSWACEPVEGKRVSIVAEDVRRERTGLHATVYLTHEDELLKTRSLLAFDTFNVSRDAERGRLANKAHRASPDSLKSIYPSESIAHDLDLFCLYLLRNYERERFIPIRYDTSAETPTLTFAVDPFIITGGGAIFFAPPGAGKSLTLQTMAIEIACGASGLFVVIQIPVLFINLERSAVSLLRRHQVLLKALGHAEAPVYYIHGRGTSLSGVVGSARRFSTEHPDGIVFLDSLSRAGIGGSLNEDTTANKFTDTMNSFGVTWAAVGHSPRGDDTHAYGSIHTDAGADVMIQVASQKVVRDDGSTIGIQLRITKENDIGLTDPQYLAYDFGTREQGLLSVRLAKQSEFGELAVSLPMSRSERITDYLRENGPSTQGSIADATLINLGDISRLLSASSLFTRLPERDGKAWKWALAARVEVP